MVRVQTVKPVKARLAVNTMFLVYGILLSGWVTHIPTVKDRLRLSESELGLFLLAGSSGAVAGAALGGWFIARMGSRATTLLWMLGFCVFLPPPILTDLRWVFAIAVFLLGFSSGVADVGQNTQGVAVEVAYRQPILSSMHGIFSIGGFVGAALGSALLGAGVSPEVHVISLAVICAIITVFAASELLPLNDTKHMTNNTAHSLQGWFSKTILVLGVLSFVSFIGEEVITNWSGVYLRDALLSSPEVAGMGFAAFSLAMAIGRISGDALVARFGSVSVMRASMGIAGIGLAIGLVINTIPAMLLAFACAGLGSANMVPIMLSAVGQVPDIDAGDGVTIIMTYGYAAFLIGPPVIGVIAEWFSLRVSMALLVALWLITVFLADAVRQE